MALTQDGCTSINNLFAITLLDIDSLTYVNDAGGTVPLIRGSKGLLHAFDSFVLYKNLIGETITNVEWLNITAEEMVFIFEQFK